MRVEHWTSAAGQATAVEDAILGRGAARTTSCPTSGPTSSACAYSTSGHAEGSTTTGIDGDADSFTARYRDPEGRLVAALAVNRPRDVGQLRRELAGESKAAAA